MTYKLQKAAVIGAGTMGGGIAALLAGCGIPVTLLDVPAKEGDRNAVVKSLWERQVKARPAALFTPEVAHLVALGNTDDDLEKVKDADWIIEVIIEQPGPKRALFEKLDALRKPTAIVSSNTSGIPIHGLAEGRSEDFRQHFMGTHFFNPPRYMKLLEIIPTPDTDPDALAFIRATAENLLGKGVVVCKDRPNFIANRVGSYVMQKRIEYAVENDYSVEEVDVLTGPLIGNPKTATFRLTDLVGLDVAAHVSRNLYEMIPDDEEREVFKINPGLEQLVSENKLGNKTGVGFYKKVKGPGGATEFWPLNMQTGEYERPKKPRFDLAGRARQIEDPGERLRLIFKDGEGDRAGRYIIDTTLPILAYAARRIPEIADTPLEVDNAMKWGYAVEAGPFETWDMLGVPATVEKMKARDIAVAPWVEAMLAKGLESFYQRDGNRMTGVYDPAKGAYVLIERPATHIVLSELHGSPRELKQNDSASLLDLGDGVLCVEFHSKLNSLDPQMVSIGEAALELLEKDEWAALVVGNQGQDFSVGANLMLALGAMQYGQPELVEQSVKQLQDFAMAMRYSRKPVVTAPFQRVLGGGVEVTLHGARIVAAAETYMGLVETGVGLIPAGGGCKELLRRVVAPHIVEGANPLPYLQQVFETIALAKVAESAHLARAMGFLSASDRIVLNRDEQIGVAKQEALKLVESGYTPPAKGAPIYAVGKRGKAAMLAAINQMRWGNYISDHDVKVASKLAHVLAGGDLTAPQWVSEQYILDLEREAFMSLLGKPKTQERILHTLQTGKPLRN